VQVEFHNQTKDELLKPPSPAAFYNITFAPGTAQKAKLFL